MGSFVKAIPNRSSIKAYYNFFFFFFWLAWLFPRLIFVYRFFAPIFVMGHMIIPSKLHTSSHRERVIAPTVYRLQKVLKMVPVCRVFFPLNKLTIWLTRTAAAQWNGWDECGVRMPTGPLAQWLLGEKLHGIGFQHGLADWIIIVMKFASEVATFWWWEDAGELAG